MKALKKPLCYEDQINRLIDAHALKIDDRQAAIDILSRVNYYRLSAFGIGLKQRENGEKYLPGTTIQTLYDLYCFDSQLRSLLTPAIESIEIDLRTKISYHLAMTYGSDGFYNANNFQSKQDGYGNSIHSNTLKRFEKEVARRANLPCVMHHNKVYGGRFPIWVAVELFTFGMLSSLYSVMLPNDQEAIAQQYGIDRIHLYSWFLSLVEVRNICAHYNRIYNMPLKQTPRLYSENRSYQSNRLFSVLLVIKRLAKDTEQWQVFIERLVELTKKYPAASLTSMGFPTNWEALIRS